jgi:hypothetical protein
VIGNTVGAWLYCTSGRDGDLLRVWFSCSPFVPSECGVKVTAALKTATWAVLVVRRGAGAEIHRQLAARCGQNCSPQ